MISGGSWTLASGGLEGSEMVESGACGWEGSVWVDRVDRAMVRFFLHWLDSLLSLFGFSILFFSSFLFRVACLRS